MFKTIHNNLANYLTVSNLICGLISLYFSTKGNFSYAVWFILLGGLADMFDGKVARITKTTSELGKYLDSNSDLITFGVAPAGLIFFAELHPLGVYGWLVLLFYIICASYRLAKYNLMSVKGYFIGIPTTFAGPLLALSYFLTPWLPHWSYLIITLILGISMVSGIKVKKVWY